MTTTNLVPKCITPKSMDLKPGIYQHYKGNTYEVLGLAIHTETHEELVIYRRQSAIEQLWVRPLKMFEEAVDVDGYLRPRFQRL